MLEIVEELASGVVVAGKYRLDRVLGQGGMGVVWAAREIVTNLPVALKFLREGADADGRARERFMREGRAAMAITHPHVARVYAVLESHVGTPFIVMELLEGESLREQLRRRGVFGASECARLMLPVVDAVGAAHAKGIVHRDLKPENVFLVRGTEVRVLDFGIAKVVPKNDETAELALTSTGTVLGTPVYMAPEQVFGDEDVDGRADVWALGIVIYECLAGKRPTDAEGFGQILKRITTAPLEPLDVARPGVPRKLARLVGRMLLRDRNARPSLTEIRTVLEVVAFSDDAPPSESPASVGERPLPETTTAAGVANVRSTRPPESTSRVRWALIGLAFVGVAAGAFVVGRQRTPAVTTASHASATPPPVTSAPSAVPAASPLDEDLAALLDGGAGQPDLMLRLVDRVPRQLERRNGAACLRDLDLIDQLDRLSPRSYEPASTWAQIRAQCMMLAGDCNGGKSLTRRAHDATGTTISAEQRQMLMDALVSQNCEGDALEPRDQLLRVRARLGAVVHAGAKASAADCRAWLDTERRLSSLKLEPASTEPSRRAMTRNDVTLCLVRAGDCSGANRVFRELWTEADGNGMRGYLATTLAGTPCHPDP